MYLELDLGTVKNEQKCVKNFKNGPMPMTIPHTARWTALTIISWAAHSVAVTLNRDLGFDFNVVPTASIAPRAAANPSSKLRFLGQSYTILLACTYSSEIVRSGAARAVAAAVTSVTDPPGFYSSFGQSNIMVMYRTDFSMWNDEQYKNVEKGIAGFFSSCTDKPGAKQWRREVLEALLLARRGQVVRRGMQSLRFFTMDYAMGVLFKTVFFKIAWAAIYITDKRFTK